MNTNSSTVSLNHLLQSTAVYWILKRLPFFTPLPQFHKWKINPSEHRFKNKQQYSDFLCTTVVKLFCYGDDSLDLMTKNLILNASVDLFKYTVWRCPYKELNVRWHIENR